MARPERIEDENEQDIPLEQRDRDEARPSVLDRRGPVGVTPGSSPARPAEANREAMVREEDAQIVAEPPVGRQSRPAGDRLPDRADTETMWGNESEIREFRFRWGSIQTAFVDEPRQAVRQADQLVQSVIKELADRFTHEREELVHQWDRGDNVSTEDLRVSMQRYRTYLDRLLEL